MTKKRQREKQPHPLREHRSQVELQLSDWFKPRNRLDVVTMTDWLAPVIWDGTFDRQALENYYSRQNITVGLAVFAPSGPAHQYLKIFLKSANLYFMSGYRVIFYIIADIFFKVPEIQLGPLRTLRVLPISKDGWWYNVRLMQMKGLGEYIVSHIEGEVDFLFSMTVNQVFQSEFGVETLGTSVAQLHTWWYFRNTNNLPYERRPNSAAYIPLGQGDFYYDGSVIGGTPNMILSLIEDCLNRIILDIEKGLNSTYERYLNKYFFINKPTKVLSPEYNWDAAFYPPAEIRSVRVVHHPKRKSNDFLRFMNY
ncbi:glycosyltransferase 6 domain-containing protein 1 [Otolemur garnettii]|uniref:glycosyltransferase 6 domain-containing protein 1 n=1 Tax=Otolemur garnettii TaxID=30611 RepID=UPI000644146F|nr:glycosyltransferase 6 domain-containing protein 1 [Otolemur garnettii]